jgi:hypothetical protein
LIEDEGKALITKDMDWIRLIYTPDAIVADAGGDPRENVFDRYRFKFRNEEHRNIRHGDFVFKIEEKTAIVSCSASGEWRFIGESEWQSYSTPPGDNRWEFKKINGCWRISGMTYNLSLVTATP